MRKGFELQFQIPTHHSWEVEAGGSRAAKCITLCLLQLTKRATSSAVHSTVCCFAQLAVFSPAVQGPAHEVVPPLTFSLGFPTFN